MPDPKISTLESVDVRSVWPDESRDFTPWLAEPENLTRLGEALGLTLEPRGTEQAVGSFSADILCRRLDGGSDDESWVVIENQYGRTNHDHLGKLLTYTAGLNARTVVWIAEEFRDEHRAALDLLNASTTREYAYFGIEIELLKIDDSRPAPRFNIVAQPNDWTKTVQAGTGASDELSETQEMQLAFWTSFREFMESEDSVACTQPAPGAYMRHYVGISGIWILSVFSTFNSEQQNFAVGELRVDLEFGSESAQALFDQLSSQKDQIEVEADQEYAWEAPTRGIKRRVSVRRDASVQDRINWPEYQSWLKTEVERMYRVVVPKARQLAE